MKDPEATQNLLSCSPPRLSSTPSFAAQVLFHDVTFTMGQVVSREGQGRQETLFRCVCSMPSDPDRAYNSCYSAGEGHQGSGAGGRGIGAGHYARKLNVWTEDARDEGYYCTQEAEKGAGEGREKWQRASIFSLFSGVFHLHQGDTLSVTIPRARAKFSLSPHGTFLGFVKL